MMEGEVNLGLSLGLGGASGFHRSPRLPPPQLRPVASPLLAAHERAPAAGTHWCHLFASSASDGRRSLVNCPFPKGVDANGTPATDGQETDAEEEDGVSSPNSTLSCAVSGGGVGNNKRSESGHRPDGSVQGDENELERAFSRVMSDEEDGGDGSQNKKLRLSKEQAAILEASFKEHHTLNPRQKLVLAKQLNVRPRQVEVWFQNRRARTKLKQTEVDCELLRRCCQGLTEENRRLQKEVHELRALKLLSPQHFMHMTPATTLTLCPSCERPPSLSSAPNPNPNPSPTVALASPLAPPLAVAGGQHLQQSPQQRLRPHAVLPPPPPCPGAPPANCRRLRWS